MRWVKTRVTAMAEWISQEKHGTGRLEEVYESLPHCHGFAIQGLSTWGKYPEGRSDMKQSI